MKIVYNKYIPFKGFFAINLFGTLFIRNEYKDRNVNKLTINHESIHTAQALDFVFGCENLKIIGYLIFYIIYFIEWLFKTITSGFTLGKIKAYRSISFEQEAYSNERNLEYLQNRKRFNWIKYLFKVTWK